MVMTPQTHQDATPHTDDITLVRVELLQPGDRIRSADRIPFSLGDEVLGEEGVVTSVSPDGDLYHEHFEPCWLVMVTIPGSDEPRSHAYWLFACGSYVQLV